MNTVAHNGERSTAVANSTIVDVTAITPTGFS